MYLYYQDKYDLLDNLIEGHIKELQVICSSALETSKENQITWFEYFKKITAYFGFSIRQKCSVLPR